MISWGLVAAAMMFVHTPIQFYTFAFSSGLRRRASSPAILYLPERWFPRRTRAGAVAHS